MSSEVTAQEKKVQRLRDRYEALEKQMPKSIIGRNAQKEADAITKAMNKIDAESEVAYKNLSKARDAMNAFTEKHGLTGQTIAENAEQLKNMGSSGEKTFKNFMKSIKGGNSLLDKFASRVKRLAIRVFVFSLITKAFRSMVSAIREGLNNLVQYSSEYNSVMSEFKSQTETLKNALATAFAPIVTMIIPYLTKLCSWLVIASNAISQFFAVLKGKSTYTKAKQQMVDYAKTIKKTADEANKLASFDDINVLEKDNGGDSGGGALTGADAFEEAEVDESKFKWVEWLKENFETIRDIAIAIGATLLACKIANSITSFFGLMGTYAIAISLVVGGIVALGLGLYDIYKNGELTNKAIILIVGGITAIGLAISLLIGGWIPLLVTAVVAVVTAIVLLIIKNWDKVKAWWATVVAFFKKKWADFTKDVKNGFNNMKTFISSIGTAIKNGFVSAFEGMWNGIKKIINKVIGGIESMVNRVIDGINFMIEKLNKLSFDVPDFLGGGHVGFNITKLENVTLKKLATGGITERPTTALIGENGREAVLPLENNTEWMDILADRIGSGNVTIKFDGSLAQLARVLNPVLDAENTRIGTKLVVE